jgi:hypothetical protein
MLTERSLQFSKIVNKSLGNPISPSSLSVLLLFGFLLLPLVAASPSLLPPPLSPPWPLLFLLYLARACAGASGAGGTERWRGRWSGARAKASGPERAVARRADPGGAGARKPARWLRRGARGVSGR